MKATWNTIQFIFTAIGGRLLRRIWKSGSAHFKPLSASAIKNKREKGLTIGSVNFIGQTAVKLIWALNFQAKKNSFLRTCWV